MSQTTTANGNPTAAKQKPERARSTNRLSTNPQPLNDAMEYAKHYARERPEVAALWCFGIGFIVGWKIKPW